MLSIYISKKYFRLGGMAPSEPSETPRGRITPRPPSIQRVAFHIALWSLFHRWFSFCRSPILNDHSGVVANCDYTSEWVHWVRACIGIAMRWVTLQKSLLTFLLPARKCNALFTTYTGLKGDGWRWEYLSSRSFYQRAKCHSLFTNYTHHSTSLDLCGYWQSIVRSVRLLSYY